LVVFFGQGAGRRSGVARRCGKHGGHDYGHQQQPSADAVRASAQTCSEFAPADLHFTSLRRFLKIKPGAR
jgi:hypothetical protein